MTDIHIFIVNYNEQLIISDTIRHYRKYLPSAKITICDNYSTDDSVNIARSLGCDIISWNTDNKTDEEKLRYLKNNIWKEIATGWVIMCDMDEWLCIRESELLEEMAKGVTIVKTTGFNIIGDSMCDDISDISLNNIYMGVYYPLESKSLCFDRRAIKEINYSYGAHVCSPAGVVKHSSKEYLVKHMDWLGIGYKQKKNHIRKERSREQWARGWDTHYNRTDEQIATEYMSKSAKAIDLRVRFPAEFS